MKSVEKSAFSLCTKMTGNQSLTLKSFKKDRSVEITKLGDSYFIIEDGFEKNSFEINEGELKHELKRLIEREFPRSHKVMLSTRSKEH